MEQPAQHGKLYFIRAFNYQDAIRIGAAQGVPRDRIRCVPYHEQVHIVPIPGERHIPTVLEGRRLTEDQLIGWAMFEKEILRHHRILKG